MAHWRASNIEQKSALEERRSGASACVLVKDLGLGLGNSVQNPAVHDETDDEPKPLNQTQSSNYRSQIARCFFLSQDRADITLEPTHVKSDIAQLCTIQETS